MSCSYNTHSALWLSTSLTVFVKVQLLYCMNVTQLSDSSLDLGSSFSTSHVNFFNHLLLLINPIEPVFKHGQTHRLQDIRVF